MAKLRETLDMLEKREAYLQKKVEKELLVAKQNATKNKRGTSISLAMSAQPLTLATSCARRAKAKEDL